MVVKCGVQSSMARYRTSWSIFLSASIRRLSQCLVVNVWPQKTSLATNSKIRLLIAKWSNLGPSPGGSPGSCSNGRVGFTCAECPRGTFASLEGRCAQCAEGNQALWMTLGCEIVMMLEDLRNCWLIWVDLLKCDVFIFKVPCDVFDFLFQRYWIYRGKWSTTSSSTLGYSLRFWVCFNKGDVMLFSMGTRAILVVCFSSNSRLFKGEQENVLWGNLGDTLW